MTAQVHSSSRRRRGGPRSSRMHGEKKPCCTPCAASSAGVEGDDTWLENAARAAGRADGAGASYVDQKTGAIGPGIAKEGYGTRDVLPGYKDGLAVLRYLADLGYIEAHQNPTLLAAMHLYPGSETGFYIGTGLMKHRISKKQLVLIRESLKPEHKKGFDAAVSYAIGRVVLPYKTPRTDVFGIDTADASKSASIAGKLATGDYAGAAGDAGGDIAKGAAIGATVAAATGTIIATGAAVGTAIPIPVVGTAAGAAVGAAIAGGIALGNAIFGSRPAFSEDDYTRYKQKCVNGFEGGPKGVVRYGQPPDQYGACMYPQFGPDAVSGGDWPFPGTWNHEIRNVNVYNKAKGANCRDPLANAPIFCPPGTVPAPGSGFPMKPIPPAPKPAPMPKIVKPPPKAIAFPKSLAGAAITMGMRGGTPAQTTNLMQNVAKSPEARVGAVVAVEKTAVARMSVWHKILHFLHLE